MRPRYLVFLSVMVLGCFAADKAAASVIYSYVTDQPNYTGSTGSTVPVKIYLQEALDSGSTSFISANGGVISAGAGVNISSTTGGTAASIASSSFTISSNFGGPNTVHYNQGTGNNLEFIEGISSGDEVFPSGGLVYLGTLNVTVGTGKSTYSLTSLFDDTINGSNSDLGQENGNTLVLDPVGPGTDLDATGNSAFTGADAASPTQFTVSVPEPSAFSLVGLFGAILLLRRSRPAQAA